MGVFYVDKWHNISNRRQLDCRVGFEAFVRRFYIVYTLCFIKSLSFIVCSSNI